MTTEELNAEVTRLMHEMLGACEQHITKQTNESYREWIAATKAYVAKHRQLFERLNPGVDYEQVYGGNA
jgi:hypothetical protein